MFSINHWCVFATAEALLVPRDESRSLSDAPGELRDGVYRTPASTCQRHCGTLVFDRGDPRRSRCSSSNSVSRRSATASRCKFLRLRRRPMAGLLCTIDKIDRDLERTEQPGCRTMRRFQRGKR